MHTTNNHHQATANQNAKIRNGGGSVRRALTVGAIGLGLGLGSLTGISAAAAGPFDPIGPLLPNCFLEPEGCPGVPDPDPGPVVNPGILPDLDDLEPLEPLEPCWLLPEGCGPVDPEVNPDIPQIDPDLVFPIPCWQLPLGCPPLDPPVEEEEPPAEEPPAEEPPVEEPAAEEPPVEEAPAEQPAPTQPPAPAPQPTTNGGGSTSSGSPSTPAQGTTPGDTDTKVLGISVERVDADQLAGTIPASETAGDEEAAADDEADEDEAVGEVGEGTSLGPIAIGALGALAGITGMALLLPVIRRRDTDDDDRAIFD